MARYRFLPRSPRSVIGLCAGRVNVTRPDRTIEAGHEVELADEDAASILNAYEGPDGQPCLVRLDEPEGGPEPAAGPDDADEPDTGAEAASVQLPALSPDTMADVAPVAAAAALGDAGAPAEAIEVPPADEADEVVDAVAPPVSPAPAGTAAGPSPPAHPGPAATSPVRASRHGRGRRRGGRGA